MGAPHPAAARRPHEWPAVPADPPEWAPGFEEAPPMSRAAMLAVQALGVAAFLALAFLVIGAAS